MRPGLPSGICISCLVFSHHPTGWMSGDSALVQKSWQLQSLWKCSLSRSSHTWNRESSQLFIVQLKRVLKPTKIDNCLADIINTNLSTYPSKHFHQRTSVYVIWNTTKTKWWWRGMKGYLELPAKLYPWDESRNLGSKQMFLIGY